MFDSLRYRDFRLLWLGVIFGNSAMLFDFYAQPWYIVQTVDSNTNFILGFLGFGRGMCMIGFSMYGGVLADRLNRRRLLLMAQVASIGAKAALAVLIISGSAELWQVMPLMFLSAAGQSVDQPVRQAIATELVPAKNIPNAMALVVAAQMGAVAVLPPLIGVFIDHLGVGQTFAIGISGHVMAIVALLMMTYQPRARGAAPRSVLMEAAQGVRYLARQQVVLWVVVVAFVAGGLASPLVTVLASSWMRNVLGLTSTGYTTMAWLWGMSASVAALALSSAASTASRGRLYVLSSIGMGATMLLYAFTRSLPLTGLAWLLNGAAFAIAGTTSLAIVQTSIADEFRGRVMALLNLRYALSQATALPIGVVADHAGLTTVVPAVAIACTVLVGGLVLLVPTLRSLDRSISAEAGQMGVRSVSTQGADP